MIYSKTREGGGETRLGKSTRPQSNKGTSWANSVRVKRKGGHGKGRKVKIRGKPESNQDVWDQSVVKDTWDSERGDLWEKAKTLTRDVFVVSASSLISACGNRRTKQKGGRTRGGERKKYTTSNRAA